ncbi:hypothetical protein DPMN_017338 [Dreissena polymorpha]|uniref:Uncharacterized protein n=1 Tax=Dreissena polymorpha TaxID=45954 RepID=A0A9D4NGG9_DREPO|nr:hypothetical protein DPMN_017338 [Dreissena polymorpha]
MSEREPSSSSCSSTSWEGWREMLVDAEGWAFGGWFAKVSCVRGTFLSGWPFLGLTSLCRKAQFLWMNSSLSVKFAAAWSDFLQISLA